MPIEIINGGHGIKNPMSGPELTPEVKAATEKLPPLRPESDPSKFQCRMCTKTELSKHATNIRSANQMKK